MPKLSNKSKTSFKNSCLNVIIILLLVSGLILLILHSSIFKWILKSLIVLKPGSVLFQMWKTNPFPYTFDIYLFNWTNPGDLYNNSIKPKFQELGPYVFQETFEKVNISWNENGTITYDLMQKWHFNRNKSAGNLDVDVVVINPLILATSYLLRHSHYFVKKTALLAMQSLSSNKVYAKHKLSEVLFDGYEDAFLKIIRSLPSLSTSFPVMEKVGYFYKRNNSIMANHMNMENGDINEFGRIKNWQFKNHSGVYEDQCGEVRGSLGDFYPPGRERSSIELFVVNLCRAIKLDYVKDVEVNGITGYKYSGRTSMLDNGTLIPKNACFYPGENIPSGVLNISSCHSNSPAFASLPHFYNADPYYTNMIDGMHPEKRKHEFYTILEPITGFLLEMAGRSQINFLVQPVEGTGIFENVPKFYYPVLWAETKITMSEERLWQIKMVSNISLALQAIGAICLVVGFLMLIILHRLTIIFGCKKLCSGTREMKLSNEEEPLRTHGTHPRSNVNY